MPPRRVRWIGRFLSLIARVPWLWALFRGPVQRFWNRNAGSWDANESPGRVQALRAGIEAVGEPARILEIGSGTGSGTALLKARFPECGGHRRRPLAGDGPDRAGESPRRHLRAGRRVAAAVPGRELRPRRAEQRAGLLRRARAGARTRRSRAHQSTFGPVTPYYTPHNVLRRRFAKLGFTGLRSEQSPPGDWFLATKP